MTELSPSETSPVASLRSQLWRWKIGSVLVGGLLALGYQWHSQGWRNLAGWEQFFTPAVWQPVAWFMSGWFLGGLLLWADEMWSQRWYDAAPLTRSVGFLLVLLGVSLFVVTTAGSGLGSGLVLSVLTGLVGEVWLWQADPAAFRQRFLGDIRSEAINKLEAKWTGKWGLLVGVAWLIVVLVAWL